MVKIIGHKGAAGYAPENTLVSFQLAIGIGCDRAEMDVRITRDGEAVVFHDKEVDKLTDGHGLVDLLTLGELKKLNCKDNEKIPTLQEVIDLCKGKVDLQIELKAEGTPEVVNQIILKNNIISNVVITSFKSHLLQQIKNLNPKLKVGLLFWKKEDMENVWKLAETIPLDFIGPSSEIVTKELIDNAHKLGKDVYAYHVNDKILGDKLIALGVDEIGTDYPRLFKKESELI